jgi:hypothetical protein
VQEKKEQNLDQAMSSVMRRDVGLRGAASIFHFTHSKTKDRGNVAKIHNSVRNEIKTKHAGHPKGFSVEQKQDLEARLKDSTRS